MRVGRKLEKLLIQCITENQERAYRLAYSYVRNKEDALDIVQDAIHKAFMSIENLKNTGSLKSCFFRIIVTTSLDFIRKQKKVQIMDEEKLEVVLPNSQDHYADLDLARSLNELPDKYRILIILRFFDDMKIEEIAEVLNENLSAVKTRLYQGLADTKYQDQLNDIIESHASKDLAKWEKEAAEAATLAKMNGYAMHPYKLLIQYDRLRGDIREHAIVLTFLRMGLRVYELCDLKLMDLTMSDRKGIAYIRGKGDKDRELPISSELLTALQAYLDTRNDDSPYVFVSRRSPKFTERGIHHMIEKYRRFTGIKHLNCHSLQHTFGHDLLEATMDLQKVANLMGHYKENGEPNIQMTMIYTTPSKEDLEDAVELISWT